jgi:hypothetical protein
LAALASNASAAHIPGMSQLGGWVYIDKNNDGILNFANQPNPEYVIPDVSISLFSKVGNTETLVSTLLTDQQGRYLFENINPGTYVLRQTQPVEFVDGLDTLGTLFNFNGGSVPQNASAGTVNNNAFLNIVLPADVGGEFYNFGERGLNAGYASKRFLLASYPSGTPAVPEPAAFLLATLILGASFISRRRS